MKRSRRRFGARRPKGTKQGSRREMNERFARDLANTQKLLRKARSDPYRYFVAVMAALESLSFLAGKFDEGPQVQAATDKAYHVVDDANAVALQAIDTALAALGRIL
jgi:hypothetical protein